MGRCALDRRRAVYRPYAGIEFVRRFQSILYSETHEAKPDALVETQTVNALFRDSSDVTRLNDIWYATRNVPEMMRLRARIAHISGWPVLDTDNASSTTLKDWWGYMQAQPTIGIPALYFVTRTESTLDPIGRAVVRTGGAVAGLYCGACRQESKRVRSTQRTSDGSRERLLQPTFAAIPADLFPDIAARPRNRS